MGWLKITQLIFSRLEEVLGEGRRTKRFGWLIERVADEQCQFFSSGILGETDGRIIDFSI